jgi:hypothetical protein
MKRTHEHSSIVEDLRIEFRQNISGDSRYCHLSGFTWLITTGSGLDVWIYWHPLVQSLLNTINLLPRTRSTLVLLSQFSYNFWTQLLNWTELTQRSHVSSLYNFEKNRIEITISNISSISMCLSVAVEMCLASRCLEMDVAAVLLWLHTSGVQASCHNM